MVYLITDIKKYFEVKVGKTTNKRITLTKLAIILPANDFRNIFSIIFHNFHNFSDKSGYSIVALNNSCCSSTISKWTWYAMNCIKPSYINIQNTNLGWKKTFPVKIKLFLSYPKCRFPPPTPQPSLKTIVRFFSAQIHWGKIYPSFKMLFVSFSITFPLDIEYKLSE